MQVHSLECGIKIMYSQHIDIIWKTYFIIHCTQKHMYKQHVDIIWKTYFIIHETQALRTHEHQMKNTFPYTLYMKVMYSQHMDSILKTYFIIYYTRNPCTQHLDVIWKTYFIIHFTWSTCTRNTWTVHGKHISIIHYAWKHQIDKYVFRFQIMSTSNFTIDPGLYIITYCFLSQTIQRRVCMIAYWQTSYTMKGTPNTKR